MKPVSVRFKCFGPYMQEQFVDFTRLEKSGLFLITGETGAGKTTILDAMCYALYCESSGGKRGNLESMRCKLADKKDETEVEFIFDNNGRRYKFTRSLKSINKRKSKNPESQTDKTKGKEYNDFHCCYVLLDGVWQVLEDKQTTVNKRAESIVGLTKEQFRQVIILPQGQFEQFLVADSDEKEAILATLFNAEQWKRICTEISKRVKSRENALDLEKIAIGEGLRRYGCAGLDAMEEKGNLWEAELADLIPRAEEAAQAEEQARETLQAQQQTAKDHDTLAEKQKAYQQMKQNEDSIRKLEESLSLADRAEQIRETYDGYRNARRQYRESEGAVQTAGNRLRDAVGTLEAARRGLERHLSLENAMKEKETGLLRLGNARPIYETLDSLANQLSGAQKVFNDCDKVLNTKITNAENRERALAAAFETYNRAMDAYKDGQIRYRMGIGGILAATLKPGERCPVCGSQEHPQPAPMIADSVTDAQLDALHKAMDKADKDAGQARKDWSGAEEERNRALKERGDAEQALTLAQANYTNAQAQKIAGIETAADLNRAVKGLEKELREWQEAGKNLQDACNRAQGNFQAAEQNRKDAEENLEAAAQILREQKTLWEAACAGQGFSSEADFLAACLEPREKQNRRHRVNTFRSDLKVAKSALEEAKKAVGDRPRPDIAALKQVLIQAQDQNQKLSSKKLLLMSDIKKLREDQKQLTLRTEKYREAHAVWETDNAFAQRLAGSNGVSLQRYVLGVMMNSVTSQANRLLENVYGGRYRIYRTNDATGGKHKAGLELEVYDSHNNQRRSVKTLSGGEKFLVALSLAIGLSTVVQAQGEGIRLEAMFIDEGFGSLDRESIQDALEILQSIRHTAGVVGIISHVEALAETIPVQLRITKGRNGSNSHLSGL